MAEIVRRSVVTRLGAGVDSEGALSREACERVYAALAEFRREIDAHRPGDRDDDDERDGGKLPEPRRHDLGRPRRRATDASFAEHIRSEYGLDARVLTGEQEAQMTFLGAMSGRPDSAEPTVVSTSAVDRPSSSSGRLTQPASTSRCPRAWCG